MILEGVEEDEKLQLEVLQQSVNETLSTLSQRFDTLEVST